jgi:hypothetical protein
MRKMMKKYRLLIPLFLLIILITACAPEQAAVEEAVLTVGDKGFSLSELEALGTISVDYTNKDGETSTYTGVPLIATLSRDCRADRIWYFGLYRSRWL